MTFTLDKFIKVIGMLSSSFAHERRVAADRAAQLLLAAPVDTDWNKVFNGGVDAAEHQAALDTVLWLQAEIAAKDRRLTELEAHASDWQPALIAPSAQQRTCRWLLDKLASREIWLSPKEQDAITNWVDWSGPLRPKQAQWLQNIVDNIVQNTGLRPPP